MGDPNPFLIDVQVTFTGPSGQIFILPAFYDGDGNGGMDGNVWKARFAPDTPGTWTYQLAAECSAQRADGRSKVPPAIPGITPGGPDFTCQGRLEYDGMHYLKFSNGG
jgi:hypothetical protein